jgi:hypothetical protein
MLIGRQMPPMRDENEPKAGKRKNELQSNITDNDSAKMKTAHETIQGYNAQAVVDDRHQIILAGTASSQGQDCDQGTPMLAAMSVNLQAIGYPEDQFSTVTLTADSGYNSEANLLACQEARLQAIIPDNHFRERDERLRNQRQKYKPGTRHRFSFDDFAYAPKEDCFTANRFTFDDFAYAPKEDCYVCPTGQKLTSYAKNTMQHGKRVRLYAGKKAICSRCPQHGRCLAKGAGRRILVLPSRDRGKTVSEQMREIIDSPAGRALYQRRIGIVEPVFANIKEQKRLQRFTMRGKIKVGIQWSLWCVVHNLEKIGRLAYGTGFVG